MTILQSLKDKCREGHKSVAVLVDPDKTAEGDALFDLVTLCNENNVSYIFVGGSLITNDNQMKV